jgi:nucleotide-binding universal stress UspA family protein
MKDMPMSYKTILVHLNHEPTARRLLSVAADIAARFEAHVIGLYVFPAYRITPPLPLPFAGDVAARIRGTLKAEEEAVNAIFVEATTSQAFTSEWRSITHEQRAAHDTVIDIARTSDIVIASQADRDWEFSDMLDFPDRLALGCGRPVMLVPNFGRHAGISERIAIAWKNRRESARAVADALPLLQTAKHVDLMTVDEGGGGGDHPANAVAWLARHGVSVSASHAKASEFTTGEEIRVRALDLRSDLLVMGCYGHSRMQEIALGGVTRHIVRETTIPVLLSH